MKTNQKEASLTVEAALVLPVFLFGVLFFLYFFQILFVQDCIQSGITETGKFISRYGYLLQKEEGSSLVNQVILKERFLEYVNEKNSFQSHIVGGVHGISFLSSNIMEENNEIEIIADYIVKISLPFLGERYSLVCQKVHTRAFVGQEMKNCQSESNITEQEELKDNTIVYVTESGTVYHRSEDCTHLKLSITNVSKEDLASARNENGGKYKSCEKCVKKGTENNYYYITKDGDKYHNSLSCSGLKRTVHSVYYSQVKDKRKCSRCG